MADAYTIPATMARSLMRGKPWTCFALNGQVGPTDAVGNPVLMGGRVVSPVNTRIFSAQCVANPVDPKLTTNPAASLLWTVQIRSYKPGATTATVLASADIDLSKIGPGNAVALTLEDIAIDAGDTLEAVIGGGDGYIDSPSVTVVFW